MSERGKGDICLDLNEQTSWAKLKNVNVTAYQTTTTKVSLFQSNHLDDDLLFNMSIYGDASQYLMFKL